MKRLWMILAAFVMTAAAVLTLPLCTGCSASPDDKLRAQVPAAAEQVAFLDLATLMSQEPYASAARESLEEMKKGLREEGLPESLLKSRGLVFACAKEKWGGALVQTRSGEAVKLYEYLLKESRKNDDCKGVAETTKGSVRSFSGTFDKEVGFQVTLHHKDLLQVALQHGKLDPAKFQPGKNALVRKLKMGGNLFSLALKFELPDVPEIKQNAEQLYKMVPSLRNLKNIFASLPAGEKAEQAEIRFDFADADSANQFKAVLDMGSGAAAEHDPELAKLAAWKADGKKVVISINIKQAVDTVNNAMQQSQARARQISSISNLKQIGLGIVTYACDHSSNCPPDLAALAKDGSLGYTKEEEAYKILIAPHDKKRKASSRQTSYAYIGKGLVIGRDNPGLPLAFEKPDLIGKDGLCNVLFLGGHVETRTVRGRTCRAIAEELLQGVAGKAKVKQLVLANADAADRDL